jgi:hypothetical protein
MVDYDGIRDVSRRINGGARSIDLVYIKDEDRIATWMGDAPEEGYVWLGSPTTYTMPGDRWEFDMGNINILFKTNVSLESAWIGMMENMKDKLPEFDYWEKI